MAVDTNSNVYTFAFSSILVIVVASLLAFTAEQLKPLQKENVKKEKMQNILASVGVEVEDADQAPAEYKKYIVEEIMINGNGEKKDADVRPFDVDVLKAYKSGLATIYASHKDDEAGMRKALMDADANFPLFKCDIDGNVSYIVPLVGKGLWGPIWGYIAIGSDGNTVAGATFDHKTETPGLGAEISTKGFQAPFKGKTIFDENGNYVSVKVMKGGAPEGAKHGVDAISGGTITSNGVTEMIYRTLNIYKPFFKGLNG